MIIHIPDRHPGRCPNMRTNHGPNGECEWLRCLDYAAVPHVCSFPEGTQWSTAKTWFNSTSHTVPKPVPWVKPTQAAS